MENDCETTPRAWDCPKCEGKYIRLKPVGHCDSCGNTYEEEDVPDARCNEVGDITLWISTSEFHKFHNQ